MRIGVDASPLVNERPTGVEKLLSLAVQAMASLPDAPELVLIAPGPFRLPFASTPAVRTVIAGGGPIAWWRERELPRILAREGLDRLHCPFTAIPLSGGFRRVATVHELAWRRAPGSEGAVREMRHRMRLRLAVRRADRVLVPSCATRDDVLAVHPAAAGKVRVITPSVDPAFLETGDLDPDRRVRARYRIPDRPFVLTIGTPRRKKNLDVALAATARIRPRGAPPPNLVLVGAGTDAGEVARRAAGFGLERRVITPGYVPQSDLPAVMRGAGALLYPSLSEGFGFPPLEAMAAGVPVVASDVDAVREVVGDAGALVAPEDIDGFARATARLFEDAAHREDVVTRGRERARRHGLAEFGRELVEIYSALAARS